MEYIVQVNDKEYGPIEDDILTRWVEDGRVLGDSQVRNSKLNAWRRADSFSFLKEAFATQQSRFKKIQNSAENAVAASNPTRILKVLSPEENKSESTDFKNSFLPDRAGIFLRLKAGIVDLLVVFALLCLCLITASHLFDLLGIRSAEAIYLFALSLHFFLVLTYFGTTLGVFAQTAGMWYYGLLLVRVGEDAKEVYLIRAYLYTLFLSIFWVFSPVINYILGNKRALHDIITNTQVVKTAARNNLA